MTRSLHKELPIFAIPDRSKTEGRQLCQECQAVWIFQDESRSQRVKCSRCRALGSCATSPFCDGMRTGIARQREKSTIDQVHKPQERDPSRPIKPVDVRAYTEPFLSFITENPTVFHAVAAVGKRLESHGFIKLSERDSWTSKLSKGGKYFFERNGSSIIAFAVGKGFQPGNGASVIASHIDALTTRLKPISNLSTKAGYVQLGVAPYAGALNNTWWDRDLGIGGRVLVKDNQTGKIEKRLVELGWPIARIPTLAPHFGAAANLSNPNKETEMVPIIGLEDTDVTDQSSEANHMGGVRTFTATQPKRLVKAIAGELNIQDCESHKRYHWQVN